MLVESDYGIKLGCHNEPLKIVLHQELILRERDEVYFHEHRHVGIDDLALEDLETLAALVLS